MQLTWQRAKQVSPSTENPARSKRYETLQKRMFCNVHWETISVPEKPTELVSGLPPSEAGEIAARSGQRRLAAPGIIPDKTCYSLSKLNLTGLQNPNRSETGILITPLITLKIQVGQIQVFEYRRGVCPLDWAMVLDFNIKPVQFSTSF